MGLAYSETNCKYLTVTKALKCCKMKRQNPKILNLTAKLSKVKLSRTNISIR